MSFLGLHTALSGVRVGQAGLDAASNNVANASSDGYTRQRVSQSESISLERNFGLIGTGATIDGVERVRDAFLDTRARATGAAFSEADTTAELLQRTEGLFAEPEAGLTEVLGEVWDAFEDLANDPSNTAAREQALTSIGTVTGRFRSIDVGLAQLQEDTGTRLSGTVTDANELLAELHALNSEISSAGTEPNDLLDRRDLVVDQLASMLGMDATRSPEGSVHLELGDELLVGDPQGPMELTDDLVAEAAGEIGALHGFVTADLPAWRAELDAFAAEFAAQLNTAHGTDESGDPVPLVGFEDPDNPSAAGIGLALTDPGGLIAGQGALDGSNAAAIADLRDGPANDDFDAALPASLRSLVTSLGRSTAEATRAADANESLFASATSARQSMHGVSIDEEMVSLIQYQRGLEASSRVMTAVDQALDVLINRTGLVGR